jgi:hypothetical protein
MKRLKYKILLSDVLVLLISVIPIYISYLTVLSNYDDNILYSQAYQNIHLLSLSDAYIHYKIYTGGSELVYFILSYVSSYYLTYTVFIVSLNAIFLSSLYQSFKKYFRNYKIIYIVTVLTNFYLYVFLLNTHKIKLALIFLMFFALFSKLKKTWLLISIITHFQVLIYPIYLATDSLITKIKSKKILILKRKNIKNIIFLMFLSGCSLLLWFDDIVNKIQLYYSVGTANRTVLITIMYYAYLSVFKLHNERARFLVISLVIIALAIVVSGDRVNFILMEYIFFIEMNRYLHNNSFALIILVPLIFYNLAKLILYVNTATYSV